MEASVFTALFLPVALFVIMLGMGLSLTTDHFKQVLITPKPVFIGLCLQIIALPVLAWIIAVAFRLPPELAVGLMLIAACPGGPTSNLISHLAQGDTALSITLTALSSVLVIIALPFIINYSSLYFIGEGQFVALPVIPTILQIVVITLIPVGIGMILKSRFPRFAERSQKSVKIVSAVFLALVIVGALAREKENLVGFFLLVGFAALALNLASMAVGYIGARVTRLNLSQVRAITVEVGIQNGTLGIAVATAPTLLNNSTMSIPAAIYSLIMFGTGALIILWGNLHHRRHG
ncbi:bile acid:sodium symporter family protein [Salinispirillum sp. LH 10-3-1]|uniref:Bile acid:sodium symporter family protein n=1 Tax=Salinispirillum sp. LH 10-3-1 TaxID=2952525 RepID=A0AB38YGA4_9GAMM